MKKISVKRSLRSVVVLVCIFMLGLSFVPLSAYASEDLTKILIPESLLSNFEEKEEIEALSADIVDMANCFEEDGFYAEVSDIDFSKAYCVFVDADILAEAPETTEELYELLGLARRVWNIPVHANGKTVLVQVSRALELSEMELDNCTEEEIERLKEKAGKWHTVSAEITLYEDEGVTEVGIGEILSINNKNADKCKCVLIGGEPGIRTEIALVLENDTISGAISLARTVTYVGGSENEVVLQQNQMYSLDEFAKVSQNSGERWLVDDGWLIGGMGGSSGNGGQGIAINLYMIGGVVLGIMVLMGMFFHRCFINKRKIRSGNYEEK